MNRLSQKAEADARSPLFAWSTDLGWKAANKRNTELTRGALKALNASRGRSSNFILRNIADPHKRYVRVGSGAQGEVFKGGPKLTEFGATFRLTVPLDVSALLNRNGFFEDGLLTKKAQVFLAKSFHQATSKGAPLNGFQKVPMTFIPVTRFEPARTDSDVME